jgi:SAM-dependent methyltransferase
MKRESGSFAVAFSTLLVWAISSVEYVGSIDEVVRAFREIERVLKPGGYAVITTEWDLVPENPRYVPGCIIFDDALVNHVLFSVQHMSLVGPIRMRQSDSPLHAYRSSWCSNIRTEIRPVCNISTAGTFATPVVLVFRKHES